MKETTREHIPQRQALFNTTKHCMGNGSEGGMGAKKGGGKKKKKKEKASPAKGETRRGEKKEKDITIV